MSALICCSTGSIIGSLYFNLLTGAVFDTFSNGNQEQYACVLKNYCCLIVLLISLGVIRSYLIEFISIVWESFSIHQVTSDFLNQKKKQLTHQQDPAWISQKICEDIKKVIDITLNTILEILEKIAISLCFMKLFIEKISTLSQQSSHFFTLISLFTAYAVCLSLIALYVSKSLPRFTYHKENLYAHLRHIIDRSLKKSKNIAVIQQALKRVRYTMQKILSYKIWVILIDHLGRYGCSLLPIFFFGPYIFTGSLSIGNYVALSTASLYILNACTVIIQHRITLVEYATAHRRILELYKRKYVLLNEM
jgi:ABC-type uncharacterized transport system fused permease/ATPase subunit